VTLFHDGHCPFCQREVAWLEQHPRRERIRLVDIQADDFDAAAWGCSFEAMMGRLHLADAKGAWFVGMDASRALYAVLGYRRLVGLTMLPGLAWCFDQSYACFARHRVRLGNWWQARQRRHTRN
jgi:predicted DCC family thiol-disulfide oxidoreductase YuxK